MRSVGLVYLVLILAAYALLYRVSPDKTRQSLQAAVRSLVKVLPFLVAIFALIGLFQAFVPPAQIEARFGASAGWASLLSGGLLGAVAMGPPVAAFPLAGSLLDAGAWPPAVAAFIVAWVSVGIISLPFEAETFGFRFALTRNLITFLAALLIGLLIGVWV